MGLNIFGALAPVFGLIILGVVLGKIDFLGNRAFEVLNRFVIAVTLPALTFRTLAKTDSAELLMPVMIAAVVGGALIVYALGYAIERFAGRNMGEANIAGLAACFSNTGFVGLPVALLAFGPESLGPVAVTMALYAALIFGIGVLISELAADRSGGIIKGLLRAGHAIRRSPLIVLSVGGVAWSLAKLPLTGALDTFLGTLAGATAPCALVAIGLFMAQPKVDTTLAPVIRVVLLKLVAHPLATAALILILPPLPPLWAAMAILMAAMPSGASSFVLAGRAGVWAMEVSAWAVTVTTAVAALTLIPILWLIHS